MSVLQTILQAYSLSRVHTREAGASKVIHLYKPSFQDQFAYKSGSKGYWQYVATYTQLYLTDELYLNLCSSRVKDCFFVLPQQFCLLVFLPGKACFFLLSSLAGWLGLQMRQELGLC